MSAEQRRRDDEAAREWKGGYRHYDLVKEASIAFGVVLALALVLTILFSSPDEPPSTIRSWSRTNPVDFVTTAVTELDGSSVTATYGPPYNHASSGQHIAFIRLQKWFGTNIAINAAKDFVLAPLGSMPGTSSVRAAVATYQSASASQQAAWTTAYTNALDKATVSSADTVSIPAGNYGPVAPMMASLLTFAQTGGLDGALLTNKQFYQTDYTKPLMFMADGAVLSDRAAAEHLGGDQWGMMNETGQWPGQAWLWLYTLWYQVPPANTSANGDIQVFAAMIVLTALLALLPFIPGLRSIPRWTRVYRLIWRNHYREVEHRAGGGSSGSPPQVEGSAPEPEPVSV